MITSDILMATAIFLASTAFTSCNVDNGKQDNEAVRFTADIGGQAADKSRASGTVWDNSDAIGIFMMDGATPLTTNKQYTTTGNGVFTATSGIEMYYPMDGSTVGFIAYYPYQSGATLDAAIGVEIATAQTSANQPDYDLLYSAGATGSKANAATPVALTFTHKLAKIVMNCAADASVDKPLTGMTVTIKGMNTANMFDLATGMLSTAATPADITPRTVTDGSVYDAIIMPGSYTDGVLTVGFTLASTGETFTWDVEAAMFEGGNEYTYDVTLKRTGIQVTGTITPWTTIDRDGIAAE